jgi:hypothetical protein
MECLPEMNYLLPGLLFVALLKVLSYFPVESRFKSIFYCKPSFDKEGIFKIWWYRILKEIVDKLRNLRVIYI